MRFESQLILKRIIYYKWRYLLIILGVAFSTSLFLAFELNINKIETLQLYDQLSDVNIDATFYYNNSEEFPYTIFKEDLIEKYPEFEVYNSIDDYFSRTILNKSSSGINWTELENPFYNLTDFMPLSVIGFDLEFLYHDNIQKGIHIIENSSSIYENGIFLDNFTANRLNITINDQISLGYLDFDHGNTTSSFENLTIQGIFTINYLEDFIQIYGFGGGYFNLYNFPTIITSINLAQDMIFELKGYKISNTLFGIISDHKFLLDMNFQEIDEYYTNFGEYIYSYSIYFEDSEIEYRIHKISRITRVLRIITFLMQLPIFLLSFMIIRINIRQIQFQNYKEYNLLKCRAATNKKIIKTMFYELILIGLIGSLLALVIGVLIYRQSSNIIISKIGIISSNYEESLSDINIISPRLIFRSISFSLLILIIAGYSYIKRIIGTENINPTLHGSHPEEDSTEWKYKRKVQAIILLLLISLVILNFIMMFSNNGAILISEQFRYFMNEINELISLIFPIIPFLILYLISKLLSPSLEQKVRQLISKTFLKGHDKLKFLFSKFRLSTNYSKKEKNPKIFILLLSLGIGFSLIFNIIIENQYNSHLNKMYLCLGGDSHLYLSASHSNILLNDNIMDNYKEKIITDSELEIDSVFKSYRQGRIDLISSSGKKIYLEKWNHIYDLLGINFSEYINTFSLTERNFGGILPKEIETKFQTGILPIIVQKGFLNELGLKINDEIKIEYRYSNGTESFHPIKNFQIIGEFIDLPGLIPFGEIDRSLVFITDISNTFQNISYIPTWNGCSLLINYNFTDDLLTPSEKYKLIQNSEKKILELNYGLDQLFYFEKKFDELYTEYSFKIEPLISFLLIEKYFLLILTNFGLFVLLSLILEMNKDKLTLLQIKGVSRKEIFKVYSLEYVVNVILSLILSSISLFLGFFLTYYLNQYWNYHDITSQIKEITFILPHKQNILTLVIFYVIFFVSYVVSYFIIIRKNFVEKAQKILRIL